ncbi:MAG: hypothetical protein FWG28_00300 [Clostridiales bacterium]|nr:hypothetical protein [Clostridiales bacterium]
MSAKEKVAYLSGLVDGLDFDQDSKEARVFDAILDALEEITEEIDVIAEGLDDLEDFVEALDEDLEDLEDILDINDDDDDDDDELINLTCHTCGCVNAVDPDVLWESDEEIEVVCSHCGAVLFSGDQFGAGFDPDDEDA